MAANRIEIVFFVQGKAKLASSVENYVFTGIGLFPGEHRIEIDPDVNPVIHAAQRIPIVLQKRLKEELNEMQKWE